MKLKTYNNRLAESVWWNLLWLTIGAFFVTVCVKSVVASHAMLAGGVLGMALLVFYNTGLLTPLIRGKGAYSGGDREILLTVTNNVALKRLENLVFMVDPKALFVVENTFYVSGGQFSRRN